MDYGYITIKGSAEASFIERKSEFIGYIKHVETPEEAIEFINEIKAKHRKATHNVYAYVLRDNNISRYSDDGEPQGTAGVPVLDVILKQNLTNVCVVVTRYFGGVLLGGGGLVRAYSHSCKIAIDASQKMNMCQCSEITAICDYSMYGKISNILPNYEVKITDTVFEDNVTIKILVKTQNLTLLSDKLIDISNGQIILEKSDIFYADFA
ncbi:MAG: YigZ family protein [Clostridiales bacterium]|nr:YigZ family protein [Clostridiales bacterium]